MEEPDEDFDEGFQDASERGRGSHTTWDLYYIGKHPSFRQSSTS